MFKFQLDIKDYTVGLPEGITSRIRVEYRIEGGKIQEPDLIIPLNLSFYILPTSLKEYVELQVADHAAEFLEEEEEARVAESPKGSFVRDIEEKLRISRKEYPGAFE